MVDSNHSGGFWMEFHGIPTFQLESTGFRQNSWGRVKYCGGGKCVFSSAKETMSPHHNHINAELMEALQMLKFTINRGQGLDFTCGMSKELELRTLELSMSEEVPVPEDINAFIQSLLIADDI